METNESFILDQETGHMELFVSDYTTLHAFKRNVNDIRTLTIVGGGGTICIARYMTYLLTTIGKHIEIEIFCAESAGILYVCLERAKFHHKTAIYAHGTHPDDIEAAAASTRIYAEQVRVDTWLNYSRAGFFATVLEAIAKYSEEHQQHPYDVWVDMSYNMADVDDETNFLVEISRKEKSHKDRLFYETIFI